MAPNSCQGLDCGEACNRDLGNRNQVVCTYGVVSASVPLDKRRSTAIDSNNLE